MTDFTYTLGDVEVGVEVTHVKYAPPQDPYLAASDWDCYGIFEVEWKVVSVEGADEDALTEEEEDYIEDLLYKDVMDRINNRDEDY